MSLAERLKRVRLERNLTLEQVAEALETSYPTIWRYEVGQRRPSGPTLHSLARLYNKTMDWFFVEDEEEQPPTLTEEEQAAIGADREMVMNEASLALRSATPNLSDTAIKAIADFIRFLDEREERERHERQEPRETT